LGCICQSTPESLETFTGWVSYLWELGKCRVYSLKVANESSQFGAELIFYIYILWGNGHASMVDCKKNCHYLQIDKSHHNIYKLQQESSNAQD
jgi:hypothetical protein